MVEEGRKLRKLILGIFFAGIVLELIGAILSFSKADLVIALLLSVAVLIAAIVELVMFLSYLSKAVKMLNGGHSSSEQW